MFVVEISDSPVDFGWTVFDLIRYVPHGIIFAEKSNCQPGNK
jgi:hypothetical protein